MSLMFFSIMFWNCQGVLSQGFCRTFNGFVRNYNPTLVAVFEPKVSGIKADNFIRKSSFARSHKVEGVGFSGGI